MELTSGNSTLQCTITVEFDTSRSRYNHLVMYRPRGALARTLYDKHIWDEHLEKMDKNQWYAVDEKLLSSEARSLYQRLALDEEVEQFLEQSSVKSDRIFTQLWYTLIKAILGWFMTQTSINGLLGRGSMFVFSSRQLATLMGPGRALGAGGAMLDLGAGDGLVTQTMAAHFDPVYVTEVSAPMRWALRKRGFRLLELETWSRQTYEVISCLNVLDRCDRPLSLLKDIRAASKVGGEVLIAVVLPYKPYVELGRADHQPTERLPIEGSTFESQASSFIRDVMTPAGFKVRRWSRVPYLCEGDLQQAYYWLNDAVFVATAV